MIFIIISENLAQILRIKRIRMPIFVSANSIFGWIISGPITSSTTNNSSPIILSGNCTLTRVSTHHIVGSPSRETPHDKFISHRTEKQCEKYFCSNHSRDFDGRHFVRKKCSSLRRFHDKPKVAKEYREFMSDYQRLGHRRPAPIAQNQIEHISSTTRLHVVFNASSVTTNGTSLNNQLNAGLKLQTDFMSVILYNSVGIDISIHPISRKCIARFISFHVT
ncbi:hypothetical protein ACFW04_014038 [Cataglyphis niger]